MASKQTEERQIKANRRDEQYKGDQEALKFGAIKRSDWIFFYFVVASDTSAIL